MVLKAMYAGVSGLRAEGEALGVVGENIANVNTTGYKRQRALFQDVLGRSIMGGGNQAGSPWALFRFMDSGNFQAKTATNFELLWDLTPQAKLKITLLAEHNRNCFGKRFFNFDCPEIVVE